MSILTLVDVQKILGMIVTPIVAFKAEVLGMQTKLPV
jgi:hypothetical protein